MSSRHSLTITSWTCRVYHGVSALHMSLDGFASVQSIVSFHPWYYCNSSLVTSECKLLHFKKPLSSLWAPSSTRLRVAVFWNRADSQWVKDTGLLSLVPPGGKKKLCHPPSNPGTFYPLGRELTPPVFPCSLHYQIKILRASPWWLQKPAQSQLWIISPTINSWHLPVVTIVVTHGETPTRRDGAVSRHRSHRKVLMGGSSIVKPQREKEMERRWCIPACLLSSPLLAGFHASFQVF